jgi:LPS-assembly protein
MAALDNGASKNIKDSNNESEIKSGAYREYRNYLNLKARQKFDDKFFYFGDFHNISDRYFLRDYADNYDEYLNSNFTIFKGFFDYDFLKIGGLKTVIIREGNDRKELDNPDEVLNVEYFYNKKLYEGDNWGNLSLNIDSSLNNVFDDDRDEFDRLSTDVNINYSNLISDLLLDFNIDLYHDKYFYFIDKNYSSGGQNRTVIDFNLNLNYNLSFDYITIQPIFQYYYNNSSDSRIFTDKDSKSSMLNITNIFSANRYNGYDLFEYGSRVNYGLELSTSIGNYGFEFVVAQGYKSDVNKDRPIENFEDNFSDILSGFNIVNADNSASFSFLNILNREDLSVERQDFILNLLYEKFELESDYALLNSKDNITEEQLSFTTRYKLSRTLKIGLEMNNDLERKRVTSVKTNLIFEENCVRLELSARQHNYVDSNGQNNWSFNASLRIKN